MQAEEAVRTLAGRYELENEIARGGMGVVWRARDTLLGRAVAVKEIFPPRAAGFDGAGAAGDEHVRGRVLREARAAAALHHPGIVTVYDMLEEAAGSYIVMELLDAESLHDTVAMHGPLDVHRAIDVGRQTASALRAAHEHGITHRDVKPRNVLLLDDGRVKLADFGISSVKDETSLTATGEVIGSPAFMSPEQAQGEPASARTDLWGLGATLYYAVEGASPFGEGEAIPTLRAVVHDAPRPMRRAGSLAPVISALLAKDPGARPAEEDLPELFDDAAATAATATSDDATTPLLLPRLEGTSQVDAVTDEPQRGRSWIVAGALAAALALAAVIALVAFGGRTSPSPPASGTRHAGTAAQRDSSSTHRHRAERSSPPTETPPTQVTPSPAPATEPPPPNDGGESGPNGVANGHDGGSPGNQHGEGDEGNGNAQGGQAVAPPPPTATETPQPSPTKESDPLE